MTASREGEGEQRDRGLGWPAAVDGRRPRVSVLMPTYNYARYLPEAVESVLAQRFRDFELVISDDGSSDGSVAIAQWYARRDPRIRCHAQAANLGMVANWNWTLQRARGEYVKFLFGDDLLGSPDSLGRMVALLDAEPRAQVVASARLLVDAESAITGVADELRPGRYDGPRLIAECLRRRSNLIGEPSAVMFRGGALRGGFDPSLRQIVDLEAWFRILLRGDLVYTREPLCGFRRHAAQQTVVNHRSSEPHREMLQLLARHIDEPAVRAHLRVGSLARHRLVFCQVHYARKARVADPAFGATVEQLARGLPRRWGMACWMLHRVTRPLENARRKLASWRQRLGARGFFASRSATAAGEFLRGLRRRAEEGDEDSGPG